MASYNIVINSNNNTTTCFFNGTIAGTTLTINSIQSGSVAVGYNLSGTGVSYGQTITALGTGTGGVGTYTISAGNNVTNINMNAYLLATTMTYAIDWATVLPESAYNITWQFTTRANTNITGDHNTIIYTTIGAMENVFNAGAKVEVQQGNYIGVARPYGQTGAGNFISAYGVDNPSLFVMNRPRNNLFTVSLCNVYGNPIVLSGGFPDYILALNFEAVKIK